MIKEELEKQLYEKMYAEQEGYLDELKTCSVETVINAAYEIAFRENILYLFESEIALSVTELKVLLDMEHPLAELYSEWLSADTNEMQILHDCIQGCAKQILIQKAEELYRNPDTPIYRKTYEEALGCGECAEWKANRQQNQLCIQMFQEEAERSYRSIKFPQFLRKWVDTYGQERCLYILAVIAADRKQDNRIETGIREKLNRESKTAEGHRKLHYDKSKILSCTVNRAAEHLLYFKEQSRKKTTQER